MRIKGKNLISAAAGSAILAFGLYEVHSISGVTEGGILGLSLLLDHWFGISPAVTNAVLSVICYAAGWKIFGKRFLVCSFVSAGSFSLFYVLLSLTPRLWPSLSGKPLIASITGALFVGVGAGLCVRAGGAQSGDDALAMILAEKTRLSLTGAYLISDITVLALSLTYIPPKRIVYSLITVLLSGQIIGLVQKIPCSWKKEEEAEQPAGGR